MVRLAMSGRRNTKTILGLPIQKRLTEYAYMKPLVDSAAHHPSRDYG
jgi:hypothetical protein